MNLDWLNCFVRTTLFIKNHFKQTMYAGNYSECDTLYKDLEISKLDKL